MLQCMMALCSWLGCIDDGYMAGQLDRIKLSSLYLDSSLIFDMIDEKAELLN